MTADRAGGGRLAGWRRREEPAILGLVTVVVLALAGLPLLAVAGGIGEGAALALPAGALRLFGRSLALAAAVTAGAVAVGVPLGLLLGRGDLPGARVCWWLHAFPTFLPPLLPALGWFHLLGRGGAIGSPASAAALFSPGGVVAILVLVLAPVVTTLVGIAARGVDASLVDAGRVVAPPLVVLRRIVLPPTLPAAALAAILVFALAFGELGVPLFLRCDVYPAAVMARLGGIGFAPGEAAALCLPLVPLAVALLGLERRFAGRRSWAVLGMRGGSQPLPLGRWRRPLGLLVVALTALSLAPLAALGGRAAVGGGLAELPRWVGRSAATSLGVAAVAAVFATALGALVGHANARGRRLGALLDGILFLAFLLPGTVVAVGLLAVWNRPAGLWLAETTAILGVAAVARTAVAAARTSAVAVAQAPASWEEAARVAGASYLHRLVGIVLPSHRRGLVAAAVLVFVLTLRDLETPALLYPPGGDPLVVRIFTLEANGPEAVVAALALLQVGMTAVALAVGGFFVGSRR